MVPAGPATEQTVLELGALMTDGDIIFQGRNIDTSGLQRVRGEMARHERASRDYEETGVQILELAQTAYS